MDPTEPLELTKINGQFQLYWLSSLGPYANRFLPGYRFRPLPEVLDVIYVVETKTVLTPEDGETLRQRILAANRLVTIYVIGDIEPNVPQSLDLSMVYIDGLMPALRLLVPNGTPDREVIDLVVGAFKGEGIKAVGMRAGKHLVVSLDNPSR